MKKCSKIINILLITIFLSIVVVCSNKNNTVDNTRLIKRLYYTDNRLFFGWRIITRSDYLLIYNNHEPRTFGRMSDDGSEVILVNYHDVNDSILFFSLVNTISKTAMILKSNLKDYHNYPIIQSGDTLLCARLIFDNQSTTTTIFQMDSAIYAEHFINEKLVFLGKDWYVRICKR